ncbi:MAG: 50S ribosomal protein L1 [Candidatus Marinimicrobia bacterium]|nr:50S ribosomal protein L1 [Candidatus Neomarinimicrobiota bacterium]MBL7109949.1 50S ribosomal protein L1 [Candidatus Neomarinimicrobiota bacterium]
MQHGKRYKDNISKIDRFTDYELTEAVKLLKELTFAKFDESVDIAVNLGVDPKHADQIVRGTVSLPHGTGKETKVLVFAKGEKAMEAEEAGADFVGSDEFVQKIQGGWTDIDVVIATPDMMGQVGKLGRVLGPRGLMPNPKIGTVTMDVTKAVKEVKAGRIEFRVEKNGIIHAGIGKTSFEADQIADNARTFIDALMRAKPSATKGTYMKKITISSTMGPGIKIDKTSITA